MTPGSLEQQFNAALDVLVQQIRTDRSILAAVLCGSLSHDTVWAHSDIDLALITTDDKKLRSTSVGLYADGVNVHAFLVTRADFRRIVEGSLRNSFTHSLLAKGRLLYTHDDSIAALHASLQSIGQRDSQIQSLSAMISALAVFYKAQKWFVTRGDLDYTALWILYTATPLAELEIFSARQLAGREVIPQAMALNPALFKVIYSDLLNQPKTRERVQRALDAIDEYIAGKAATVFAPLLDYLRDVGEIRSCTEIEDHFSRNFGVGSVITACEYLADRGIIGKAGSPVRLTRSSNIDVQELAFFHLSAANGR